MLGLWPSFHLLGCLELGLWSCGSLNTLVAGPVAVLGAMALDKDEVDDENDGSMKTIVIGAVLDRKDLHEEKTKDHYQENA